MPPICVTPKSELKNGLNVSCAWARYCGRNPNITTLPHPTCASTAALPAMRSSPCAYPLRTERCTCIRDGLAVA
jgi:hypothetical protein